MSDEYGIGFDGGVSEFSRGPSPRPKIDYRIYDLVRIKYREEHRSSPWFRNIVDVAMRRPFEEQIPTLIDGLAAMSRDLQTLQDQYTELVKLTPPQPIIITKEKP